MRPSWVGFKCLDVMTNARTQDRTPLRHSQKRARSLNEALPTSSSTPTQPALRWLFFLSFRCITLSFPLSIPLLSFPPFAPDGLGRSGHPFPKTWAVLASLRRFHSQEADLGTIVYRSTQAQATHDELASVGAFATVVAHRAIGNRLWFLAKAKTGERTGRKWIRLTSSTAATARWPSRA